MRVARVVTLIGMILISSPAMAQENGDAQAAVQLFGTILNAIAGAMSQGTYCSNGGNLCPNSLCCPYGTACMSDGGCGEIGAIYCGNGQSCALGRVCSRGGGCVPGNSVDCGGGRYCLLGDACTSDGKCMKIGDVCGNGAICYVGSKCAAGNHCIPLTSTDCGNGHSCGAGLKCTGIMNECVLEASIQCGNHYCNPGSICGSRNVCMDADVSDCGNGTWCPRRKKCSQDVRHCFDQDEIDCGTYSCSSGMKCASGGGCFAQDATDCGNGTSCPVGKICSGTQCTIPDKPSPAFTIPVPENKWQALASGTLIAIVLLAVAKLVNVVPGERTRLEHILADAMSQIISGIFLWYFGFGKDFPLLTIPIVNGGIFAISLIFTPSNTHHT